MADFRAGKDALDARKSRIEKKIFGSIKMTAETRRDFCYACSDKRDCDVLFSETFSWSSDDGDISGWNTYTVLRCRGCNTVHFLHESWCTEEWDPRTGELRTLSSRYPSPRLEPPNWIYGIDCPTTSKRGSFVDILKEVYTALDNKAPSLAAMGVRALVEWAALDKVGDKGSFSGNLEGMFKEGHIAEKQKEILAQVLDLGSAAIHRGYIPQQPDVELALSIVENMLESVYAVPNRTRFNNNTPSRKK